MKKLLIVLLVAAFSSAYGQKIKLIEGDLKALKGLKGFNTEFTYENMTVGKDKDEETYVSEKKKTLNEKEAGRGDKWQESWVADRKDRFEPQFRELFAKYSGMSTTDATSPYTLIFKTTRTEPGWNVGVMRVPAFIDAEVWIVDSKNKENVVAKIDIKNSPGRSAFGMDYETGVRLQESYAKAGKELGAFIKSKSK
jgi:hypothetical protein